jgi:hypothetical protein
MIRSLRQVLGATVRADREAGRHPKVPRKVESSAACRWHEHAVTTPVLARQGQCRLEAAVLSPDLGLEEIADITLVQVGARPRQGSGGTDDQMVESANRGEYTVHRAGVGDVQHLVRGRIPIV